jgi:hypothetical protein
MYDTLKRSFLNVNFPYYKLKDGKFVQINLFLTSLENSSTRISSKRHKRCDLPHMINCAGTIYSIITRNFKNIDK